MTLQYFIRLTAVAANLALASVPAEAATSITTYHYDNFRTGWNQAETILTPANVASSAFGLLLQVHLDEQVDAQPLYVPRQVIAGGTHNVVYVATENDTMYAIDADTGARLIIAHFGSPVPYEATHDCVQNATRLGFTSTPVYDPSSNLIYAISYTYENSTQVYRLHEINAITLQDQIPSVVISATGTLSNGTTVSFNPAAQRQRAALLLSKGNIYAGFGSFCDNTPATTRGWVLGWNAGTLQPLATNALINRNATSPNSYFESDIWMSGYGIAADTNGTIYFVTANSDPAGNTWSAANNLEESVVKLNSESLSRVDDYFTPSGKYGYGALDAAGADFGAGGVLLLPPQPGKVPLIAVAAGKAGPMYVVNRDDMGGMHAPNNVLGTYPNDGCYCGQSYFTGSDGIGRVVESTGDVIRVWQVVTSTSANPKLTLESTSPALNSGQDPGFFTSISSNGQTAGTAVIWAVSRPNNTAHDVYLQAFDPANASANIYNAVAGTWVHADANANIVPVVADGRVFVATVDYLSIFGLSTTASHVAAHALPALPPVTFADAPRQLHGIVTLSDGPRFTVRTRTGTLVRIDASAAKARPPKVGQAILACGSYDAHGMLVAKRLYRQMAQPVLWDPDM
jgi:hypothetical protein